MTGDLGVLGESGPGDWVRLVWQVKGEGEMGPLNSLL